MTHAKSDRLEATRTYDAKRRTMKLAIFVLGGALAGYLYYRFVGCRTGACPITSSPIISTVYGAMIGFLLGRS
jgi:hypothetical protein